MEPGALRPRDWEPGAACQLGAHSPAASRYFQASQVGLGWAGRGFAASLSRWTSRDLGQIPNVHLLRHLPKGT